MLGRSAGSSGVSDALAILAVVGNPEAARKMLTDLQTRADQHEARLAQKREEFEAACAERTRELDARETQLAQREAALSDRMTRFFAAAAA